MLLTFYKLITNDQNNTYFVLEKIEMFNKKTVSERTTVSK